MLANYTNEQSSALPFPVGNAGGQSFLSVLANLMEGHTFEAKVGRAHHPLPPRALISDVVLVVS